MKWLIVPMMVLVVCVQSFSKSMIIAGFRINQAFISKTLCINKAKPALGCKGKCQLKKTLAKNSNEEAPENLQSVRIPSFQFTDHLEKWQLQRISLSKNLFTSYYQNTAPVPPVFSIFHPPA